MKIYESAEDYLEKILMLTERNGEVRSIDIATEMGVTKPSVSIAMKICVRPVIFRWMVLGISPWSRRDWKLPPGFMAATKADPLFCCTGCGPCRCFPRCLQDRA